jgi:hypothetical protein
VVAGIRTPEDLDAMKNLMPQAYDELVENCNILESHYKEMQVQFKFSPSNLNTTPPSLSLSLSLWILMFLLQMM